MTPAGTNLLLASATAAAPAPSDAITKSLRFNNPDTPYLSFTPSSTGDQKKWTTAFWFKRSTALESYIQLFGAPTHGDGHGVAGIYFYTPVGKLTSYFDSSGADPYGAVNDRLYRDPAGWMQIIWAVDAVNTIHKIWINGVEESVASGTNPPDYGYAMNESGYTMKLGTRAWSTASASFDGYIAQFVHLDGQYITDPTEFGQVSSTTGEWEPIELTSSSFTYGTNGALLEFLQTGTSADSSGIGADTSGNGNHWSVSSLAASDVVNDTPTDNYAVLNPLVVTHSGAGNDTFSEGNTQVVTASSGRPVIPSTIFMPPDSGTYYAEFTLSAAGAMYGIARSDVPNADDCTTSSKIWGYESNAGTQYKVNSGTYVSMGTAPSYPVKNGVSYNTATGEVKFFVGGSDIGGYTGLSTDYSYGFFVGDGSTSVSTTVTTHFDSDDWDNTPSGVKQLSTAQLPTPTIAKPSEHFNTLTYASSGAKTGVGFQPDLVWVKARGNTYDHELTDSVRGVTKALSSNDTGVESTDSTGLTVFGTDGFTVGAGTNYSTSSMVAWNWKAGTSPSTSHTYELRLDLTTSMGGGWGDYGSYDTPRLKVYEDRGSGNEFLGYATVTYSDDYSASYVINTNNKLAIEIVWEYDDSDGGMNAGYPSYPAGTLKDGSTTMATWVEGTPDVTDGATFIAKTSGQTATGSGTLVTWAGGATGSSYNADAGFSIVTYTGNDYDGAGTEQTVNHNLGVAPEMIIVKGRTDEYSYYVGWGVYHKDLTTDYLLYLNSNAAEAYPSGGISYINNIGATSVDFAAYYGDGFNYGGDMSYSADDYIAYMFASVEGYSKVGSYTGNGLADGAFVYCGFRPAYILIKALAGYSWYLFDSKTATYNVVSNFLQADQNYAEQTYTSLDITSNGFKFRAAGVGLNGSASYIFYAVAESPFKYASAR
jgi:hypothetical protein